MGTSATEFACPRAIQQVVRAVIVVGDNLQLCPPVQQTLGLKYFSILMSGVKSLSRIIVYITSALRAGR